MISCFLDPSTSDKRSYGQRSFVLTDNENNLMAKIQKENKKLTHMLEKSEKNASKKQKESKREIEKFSSLVNKFWRVMNKQIRYALNSLINSICTAIGSNQTQAGLVVTKMTENLRSL